MHYVYIIQSIQFPDKIYIGQTTSVTRRLYQHNQKTTFHTAKYIPWKLIVYLGFTDTSSAFEFEKYLKSGTGRAMIAKRFLNR